MKVLNFGSLNLDYVYSVDHMVAPGETLASSDMNVFCGGKGLNQSIAIAKAGVPVYHAGLIGDDGDVLMELCRNSGVNSKYIKKVPGKSGHTIIQVDRNGQNCILLYGGSNRRLTKEYIDEVLSNFNKGDILLLQNEVNLLDYIIDKAYEIGMLTILNPSPCDNGLEACNLHKVSMLLLNEVEGGQITGEKDYDKILEQLGKRYPDTKIVLTLGQDGSIYQFKGKRYRQGAYKVTVVDTTAAGDTFTGYFISALIEEMPVPEGLELAAKAAAIAVSRHGATASIPRKKEVLDWRQ